MTIKEANPPKSETISHWGELARIHEEEELERTVGIKGVPDAYKRALEPYPNINYKLEVSLGNLTNQLRAKEGTLLWRQLNSKAFATQVGGNHYKKHSIQPTEYAMANALDTCQANVVKYITRFRDKGGAKDLRKVLHYVEYLLETEYPKE